MLRCTAISCCASLEIVESPGDIARVLLVMTVVILEGSIRVTLGSVPVQAIQLTTPTGSSWGIRSRPVSLPALPLRL
jgi:hypothetical protein